MGRQAYITLEETLKDVFFDTNLSEVTIIVSKQSNKEKIKKRTPDLIFTDHKPAKLS